jgi:integrase
VPGSGGSVSVTRQRRVVPIDAWLADDLRAYLANDHPHGEPASPDYDPSAPLFPGRYGMTEPLSEGFSRDEIEPVRPMVADPAARVSRRTGSRIGGLCGLIRTRLRSAARRRRATNGRCR